MDNIHFSNDLFRRMVQAFKPQPLNETEDVQEAVPFKKHAFGEMKLKKDDIKIKEDEDIDWEHDSDLDAEAELGL